ncbi:hypothetical protein ACI48D_20210 [Massilia sp. LXY-6]
MNEDIDADMIGQQILENDELVGLILESARKLSAPMTIQEFMAWLNRLDE